MLFAVERSTDCFFIRRLPIFKTAYLQALLFLEEIIKIKRVAAFWRGRLFFFVRIIDREPNGCYYIKLVKANQGGVEYDPDT